MNAAPGGPDDEELWLQERLGVLHARQRLSMETDHVSRAFDFLRPQTWASFPATIRASLRLTGMYGRGLRNALDLRVVHHDLELGRLPSAFESFRILHLSDLHIDQSPQVSASLIDKVNAIDYEACVMTGDYRFALRGSIDETIAGIERLRRHLKDPVFAVLGNHDSVRMVPAFERMGIRMLVNESATIERDGAALCLLGVDDAHYFGLHNIEKAASGIPSDAATILLSHTPELYRQAANAGIGAMLCGHTHGGQICLPGGYPITLDADVPRRLGRGRWRHLDMIGYTSSGCGTSIVPVRLNCPAEVTLHRLTAAR